MSHSIRLKEALKIVRKNPAELSYLDQDLKENQTVALAAVKSILKTRGQYSGNNFTAVFSTFFKKIAPSLLEKEDFAKKMLELETGIFAFLNKHHRNNPDIFLHAIRYTPEYPDQMSISYNIGRLSASLEPQLQKNIDKIVEKDKKFLPLDMEEILECLINQHQSEVLKRSFKNKSRKIVKL